MDWVGGAGVAGKGSTVPSPERGVGGGTFGRRSPSGVGGGGMLMPPLTRNDSCWTDWGGIQGMGSLSVHV